MALVNDKSIYISLFMLIFKLKTDKNSRLIFILNIFIFVIFHIFEI